ncbi:mRNA splicing protein SLU7 Ecym_7220 [Eremothecium cymbalariae DBVPG|uniref:Pre-mRNA-splicing factor SLU7 n=1 Tax=Eremothecium cymbalariae (strain CBS 270.75 / DBVPG 7215 / KCTC 17166 / NRRL Y-17582) TaxID=931890 RepID=G8JW51_ERECY|nr:hypothetical protein Ecym_7220 [Eremothecium cymbalariae DBVPG\
MVENKHIPKYIRDRPWYIGSEDKEDGGDYLGHHRIDEGQGPIDYSLPKLGNDISDKFLIVGNKRRGKGVGGKCCNCGSLGHEKRDCLERPRKQRRGTEDISKQEEGAGKGEERAEEFKVRDESGLNFDAKRDRWFGYDDSGYNEMIKRSWLKRNAEDTGGAQDKAVVDFDVQIERYKLGLVDDTKSDDIGSGATSDNAPSIRLREDKAKYLNDLNSEELKYDPKSRLYKDKDLGEVDPKTKMFHRHLKGESVQLVNLGKKVRESASKAGIRDDTRNINKPDHVLAANPTKYEILLMMGTKGTADLAVSGNMQGTDRPPLKRSDTEETNVDTKQKGPTD